MTLKHSAGPWTYDKIRRSIINGRDKPICEMTQYSYEGDLDVLLAAPTMLRLLRVLVPMSESGAEDREGWMVWNAALNEASELIAKLDGDTCHGN